MRKGLFYICLLLVGVGLFAGCKSKKAVVASFSDLDGEWGVVEMNGKTLNPEETHQVWCSTWLVKGFQEMPVAIG